MESNKLYIYCHYIGAGFATSFRDYINSVFSDLNINFELLKTNELKALQSIKNSTILAIICPKKYLTFRAFFEHDNNKIILYSIEPIAITEKQKLHRRMFERWCALNTMIEELKNKPNVSGLGLQTIMFYDKEHCDYFGSKISSGYLPIGYNKVFCASNTKNINKKYKIIFVGCISAPRRWILGTVYKKFLNAYGSFKSDRDFKNKLYEYEAGLMFSGEETNSVSWHRIQLFVANDVVIFSDIGLENICGFVDKEDYIKYDKKNLYEKLVDFFSMSSENKRKIALSAKNKITKNFMMIDLIKKTINLDEFRK